MRSSITVCILILSPALAAGSSLDLYSEMLSMEGDTFVRQVELVGIQGTDRLFSRLAFEYDPAHQSVTLETAERGFPGSDLQSVPEWAVDTLGGSLRGERSLVVAFPALAEGMEVHYGVTLRDWSDSWSAGPWAMIEPGFNGVAADSCIFIIQRDILEVSSWQADGYSVTPEDGILVLSGGGSSGALTISPFDDFGELARFLLLEADNELSKPFPPDLREAALQATSAGADAWSQSMRARTLLCNSIAPLGSNSNEVRHVRPIQDILDTREATPLEMAVVFAAVCSELGMEAVIVPSGGSSEGLPVPYGWNRYLVALGSGEGTEWMVEPSAYLSSADWIHRPQPLNCILGERILVLPSDSPEDSRCSENWTIDLIQGTYELELTVSGWFDMVLRRRTAGLRPDQLLLSFSEWCWRGGRVTLPESLSISDPYQLDREMVMTVSGRLGPGTAYPAHVELLPALEWEVPDSAVSRVSRSWLLPGVLSVAADDRTVILDPAGHAEIEDDNCNGVTAVLIGRTR